MSAAKREETEWRLATGIVDRFFGISEDQS